MELLSYTTNRTELEQIRDYYTGFQKNKMNIFGYQLRFIYYIAVLLFILPLSGQALKGAVADPMLLHQEGNASQLLHGSIQTQFIRNIRVNNGHILDTDYKDNILSSFNIQNDITLNHSLEDMPILKNIEFLRTSRVFYVFTYRRPVYTSVRAMREVCWNTTMCLGDIQVGISNSVLKKPQWSGKLSNYIQIPISKTSITKSLLLGIGSKLELSYDMFSYTSTQFSAMSTHILHVNWFMYDTSNAIGTVYNVPFITVHQLGWYIKQQANGTLIPNIFLSGSYGFSMNFKQTPFHQFAMGVDGIWNINKKVRIVAGFKWGDRVLKPQDTELTPNTVVFNPDRTFVNVGASYIF